MERKIKEIFEYNGEWYQCIVGNGCKNCAFNKGKCYTFTDNNNPIGDCSAERRTDKYSVIFKKLEKVGKPYTTSNDKVMQNYLIEAEVSEYPRDVFILTNYGQRIIAIEIKQNKEDMEEKKVKISRNNADYLINKLQYILDERIDGEGSDMIIAEFEELLDIEHSNSENIEKNLKPFDIQKAKQGKPVCTRDGRKARIICFDKKGTVFNGEEFPIVALLCDKYSNKEIVLDFTKYGKSRCNGYPSNCELMMLPEKKEGWVNVYNSLGVITFSHNPYDTKEEALEELKSASGRAYCVDTIKICWRE